MLVPLGVVTVTWTVPLPAGATAVITLSETTVNEVAAVAPNFTDVAPVKWLPVKVTDVPPVLGPWVGLIPLRVGTTKGARLCGAWGLFKNLSPCTWGPADGAAGAQCEWVRMCPPGQIVEGLSLPRRGLA